MFTSVILWVTTVVVWTGILGFLGFNYYEITNSCTFKFTEFMLPLGCVENIKPSKHIDPCYTKVCPFKPLILLYPTSDTLVNVTLKYPPGFSATYPDYDISKEWWSVIAHSDGTLIDIWVNQDTYGLFWEGNPSPTIYDISKWFVIKWSELRDFLYNKLTEIGLNTKEKSDFIMYWYPKLQEYPYIQITFAGEDYTNMVKLNITPTPDSLLRVFMVAKPLREYKQIPEQKFTKFERKWFSVVEWWGTIVQ